MTDQTKHTPAPWMIEEYGDDAAPALVIHRGETENRICFMATPGSQGDPAMIEADAMLIAAAPDMLSALRHARMCIPFPSDAHDKILAAIKKATGESADDHR